MQMLGVESHTEMSAPNIYTYDVVFENDLLGMVFVNGERDEGAYVNGFYRERTKVLEAEDSMQIALRDRVISIQGRSVKDLPFTKVLELLRSKKRPLRLTFERVQSSLTEENWKDALDDKHFRVLFKSFLKRKHLLLCHVWFSFVLEVNRCASLKEKKLWIPSFVSIFNRMESTRLICISTPFQFSCLMTSIRFFNHPNWSWRIGCFG